jgi:hypothetical protein
VCVCVRNVTFEVCEKEKGKKKTEKEQERRK